MVAAVIISTKYSLLFPILMEGWKICQILWHNANLACALSAALKIKPLSLLWCLGLLEFVFSMQSKARNSFLNDSLELDHFLYLQIASNWFMVYLH